MLILKSNDELKSEELRFISRSNKIVKRNENDFSSIDGEKYGSSQVIANANFFSDDDYNFVGVKYSVKDVSNLEKNILVRSKIYNVFKYDNSETLNFIRLYDSNRDTTAQAVSGSALKNCYSGLSHEIKHDTMYVICGLSNLYSIAKKESESETKPQLTFKIGDKVEIYTRNGFVCNSANYNEQVSIVTVVGRNYCDTNWLVAIPNEGCPNTVQGADYKYIVGLDPNKFDEKICNNNKNNNFNFFWMTEKDWFFKRIISNSELKLEQNTEAIAANVSNSFVKVNQPMSEKPKQSSTQKVGLKVASKKIVDIAAKMAEVSFVKGNEFLSKKEMQPAAKQAAADFFASKLAKALCGLPAGAIIPKFLPLKEETKKSLKEEIMTESFAQIANEGINPFLSLIKDVMIQNKIKIEELNTVSNIRIDDADSLDSEEENSKMRNSL